VIGLGAYKAGSDRAVDDAIRFRDAVERFVVQPGDQTSDWDSTLTALSTLGQ
jgi:flagellar biosynthesis/type III secretory pathway ATPase